jgi:hypothetical protein
VQRVWQRRSRSLYRWRRPRGYFLFSRPACATKSPIAFSRQLVLRYYLPITSKCEPAILLMAHLDSTFRGCRWQIAGRNEKINANPRPLELLPQGGVQSGAAAP